MNYRLKSCGSPSVASQHAAFEWLAENALPTHDAVAPKAARFNQKGNAPNANGEIRGATQIAALYAPAGSATVWAKSDCASCAQQYLKLLSESVNLYDH